MSASKSSHQLPFIPKVKPSGYSSPILERMKSLHNVNLNNIYRQKKESHQTIDSYVKKKTNYFQSVHKKKEANVAEVLKNLTNKSSMLQKINIEKTRRHQTNYKTYIGLTKEKAKARHLKEIKKVEQAQMRKSQLNESMVKQVIVKKPDYQKIELEAMNKSRDLQKTSTQKLQIAQTRRNQLKKQKEMKTKGKLDSSISYALSFIGDKENQRKKSFLQKSILKLKQTQRFTEETQSRVRSHSERHKKMNEEKLFRAKSIRKEKESQMIEKLEKILQEKAQKTSSIHQRKAQNLEKLSESLKKSRRLIVEKTKSRMLLIQQEADQKGEEILSRNHQQWRFMTDLKLQQAEMKNLNLYESQQVSLRA